MKKFIFITISLLPILGFSQKDSTNWVFRLNPCKITLGYIYQGEHILESGLKLEYINNKKSSKNHGENISLISGGQLSNNRKTTYLNPFVSFRYLKPIKNNLGVNLSLSYNNRKISSITSSSFTPEIGLTYKSNNSLSIGYNFFIQNKYEWVTNYRASLRLMLF